MEGKASQGGAKEEGGGTASREKVRTTSDDRPSSSSPLGKGGAGPPNRPPPASPPSPRPPSLLTSDPATLPRTMNPESPRFAACSCPLDWLMVTREAVQEPFSPSARMVRVLRSRTMHPREKGGGGGREARRDMGVRQGVMEVRQGWSGGQAGRSHVTHIRISSLPTFKHVLNSMLNHLHRRPHEALGHEPRVYPNVPPPVHAIRHAHPEQLVPGREEQRATAAAAGDLKQDQSKCHEEYACRRVPFFSITPWDQDPLRKKEVHGADVE